MSLPRRVAERVITQEAARTVRHYTAMSVIGFGCGFTLVFWLVALWVLADAIW